VSDKDIIFGLHSVAEAIKNPARGSVELYATEESRKDLEKMHFKGRLPEAVNVTLYTNHKLQEQVKLKLKERNYKEQRAPSNLFLLADSLINPDLGEFYRTVESKPSVRILALDQVTDIHNIAAILRSAAFYNLDYLLMGKKGSPGMPPGFYRIASGASEFVPIVNCSSLSRVITKLQEMGVDCVGFAEEATENSEEPSLKSCLVLGSEDTGLSNVVRRVLKKTVSLNSQGQIKSLNVSVAAAVAMEKFYPKP
jgi:23S rRNA (guanosine2251-2'-O)-methyltransferase